MGNKRRVKSTDFTQPQPPRSGLVQLLSELPIRSAGYYGNRGLSRADYTAISFNSLLFVLNHLKCNRRRCC